jgi:hypothetical protein
VRRRDLAGGDHRGVASAVATLWRDILAAQAPAGHGGDVNERGESEWTIERHLAGQPQSSLDLYRQFIESVKGFGPFTYAVSKPSITLKGERRGFAGLRPYRDGVRGYLDLQREVRDPRITSVAPYTKRLFVHHFRLLSTHDLDDEFTGWLREAYAVGAGEHLHD